jgi:putative ABC transport system permease protein
VLSYSVAERKHEMGIRMALGATKRDITRIVAGRSGKLVATGIVAGIVSALGLTRFLSHLLNGVSRFDPLTFAVISAMLVVVAAVASVLPAHRASMTDPMTALRQD